MNLPSLGPLGSVADLEAGEPGRLLVGDLDPVDLRMWRPGLAPARQLRDRVGLPLEHGFDGAVCPVAYPAGDTGPFSLLAAGIAEEHALDIPVDDDPDGSHSVTSPRSRTRP